ncbi:MAG: dienelactone hydrolase family protein, partial [Pirellulales bacterium]
RKVYDTDQWIGYEVMLDVYADVFALGVLLVPKDLLKSQDPLQKRPCVVFQHGLEGRPKDTIEGDHAAYHNVSARLAEKGYVVFAPQNAYLFQDRFRTLQRKSNPLGRTLFSTIIGQHQQIVKWLATLPFVDGERIGFYGLSYGGKSAMRIPALVPKYKLSICSADFNDWVWKNASTKSNYSYVWTGEYEIFEFGLGPRFNYAEMAMLIAPRPFMVERGHKDGVAPDDRVASEFAKVRAHYTVRLKQPELAELEWFDGPHTIHGKGTFDFLDKHLKMKR